MRKAVLAIVCMLGACNAQYEAPYEAVTEVNAPTIRELEADGYRLADYYPVGCELPDCPECACDAIGAQFLDKSEAERDSYGSYDYVCPAMKGVELDEWKCRRQPVEVG
jgi:hypothetical protein